MKNKKVLDSSKGGRYHLSHLKRKRGNVMVVSRSGMRPEGYNVMVNSELVEALNQYKNNISIYPIDRVDKNGVKMLGMAFYYERLDGMKGRKVCSGVTHEELYNKRSAFLIDLYYQRKAIKEAARQAEAVPLVPPVISSMPYMPQSSMGNDKTVSEVIDEFMVYHKNEVHYATYEADVSNAKHIKRHLGDRQISSLKYSDILEMINKVAEGNEKGPASKKTVENVRSFFTQVVKFARKEKLLSAEDVDIITTGIKIPKKAKKYDKNTKFHSYEEIGRALRILKKNPRYYCIHKILLLTGMREQEFFALSKTALKRDGNYIQVSSAIKKQDLKNGHRAFEIGETKNEWSVRRVPAIPEVFFYFDELEKYQIKSGGRAKSYKKGNGDLVVVDREGNSVNEHTFIENYRKYIDRNAPGAYYPLNDSRHCFKTHLEKLHADYRNIEIAMGHQLSGIGDINYRGDNDAYIEELFPYIEEMAEKINEATRSKRI